MEARQTQGEADGQPILETRARIFRFRYESPASCEPLEQFPLGEGGPGDQTALIGGLGLPVAQVLLADLRKLVEIFFGQSEARAQPVAERVEAADSLTGHGF